MLLIIIIYYNLNIYSEIKIMSYHKNVINIVHKICYIVSDNEWRKKNLSCFLLSYLIGTKNQLLDIEVLLFYDIYIIY
jgi:hypothetical protein